MVGNDGSRNISGRRCRIVSMINGGIGGRSLISTLASALSHHAHGSTSLEVRVTVSFLIVIEGALKMLVIACMMAWAVSAFPIVTSKDITRLLFGDDSIAMFLTPMSKTSAPAIAMAAPNLYCSASEGRIPTFCIVKFTEMTVRPLSNLDAVLIEVELTMRCMSVPRDKAYVMSCSTGISILKCFVISLNHGAGSAPGEYIPGTSFPSRNSTGPGHSMGPEIDNPRLPVALNC